MKPAPIVAALIASLALPHAAVRQPLTTAALYEMQSTGEVQLSPDAELAASTVRIAVRRGPPQSEVFIADACGERRRVAEGTHPRWSPDGSQLAFLGRVNGTDGLFVLARAQLRSGEPLEPKLVAPIEGTNHPLPSTGDEFAWSPDGKRVAFVSSTPAGGETPSSDPMVVTRYLYKPATSSAAARFNDNRRLHIFIADVASGSVRQLTDGHFYEHSIDWSPKGNEIVFVSNREQDPDRVFNYDIFAARADTGAVRRLTDTKSAEYYPRWSPDSTRVAFLGTTRDLTSSETTMEDTHVWTMKADGSDRMEAGAGIDNRQGAPRWVGQDLAFTVQERGGISLYRNGRRIPLDGSVESWSIAGSTTSVVLSRTGEPAQLFTNGRQCTSSSIPRDYTIADVEPFTFTSFDGLEVEAFLTSPAGLDASRKYPLVTIVHGGPHAQQGPAFNMKAQIYAGAGFASLMVNYRGSTGYGQKFADAISGDQNGGEARDVLEGIRAALAKYPWIDADALFIEGTSYGGQLTNWVVTQTDIFKAAVSTAGISNLVSFNYTAYYHDYLAVEYGAYPHEKGIVDRLWERSPIRYAKDARTPVMFLHGEEDNDVPIGEAEQFYIALKDVGVETVMVRYPREGHGLRETQHVADAIDRSLAWYRAHISRAASSSR